AGYSTVWRRRTAASADCAFACVWRVTSGTVTDAGGVPLRISTAAKFHWSPVGAVSLSVAVAPAALVAGLRRCIHMVSRLGARYSWILLWPAATVRAIAWSKSMPTP